mgnify:CR=1 FL=1
MLPPSNPYRLQRLQRWLAYELSTPALFLLHYVVPFHLTLLAVVGCALALLPLMLSTLYREGRTGWILAFGVVVGTPLLVLAFTWGQGHVSLLAGGAVLLSFLGYCFVLRLAIREWLEEAVWKRSFG